MTGPRPEEIGQNVFVQKYPQTFFTNDHRLLKYFEQLNHDSSLYCQRRFLLNFRGVPLGFQYFIRLDSGAGVSCIDDNVGSLHNFLIIVT